MSFPTCQVSGVSRRLLGQLAALNIAFLHVPPVPLAGCSQKSHHLQQQPLHPFSVQCYDNWSVTYRLLLEEPHLGATLLRGAVPQPGPTLLRSSQGQPPSPLSGAPCHLLGLIVACPPGWPLQLGAASSALWVTFSKKQMPREGRGRGELQGQGLGDRQVLPMVPQGLRPPRVEFCLVSWSLVVGPPSLPRPLSSDHDRIQGGGWVLAGLCFSVL